MRTWPSLKRAVAVSAVFACADPAFADPEPVLMAAVDSIAAPMAHREAAFAQEIAALNAETTSPEAAALSAALETHPEAEALKAFYAARGMRPYWTDAGGARAQSLLTAMRDALSHGLSPMRYGVPTLRERLAARHGLDPAGAAALELALADAYLRYADDLSGGAVAPENVGVHFVPTPDSAEVALSRLTPYADVAAAVAAAAPQSSEYARLQMALRGLQAKAAAGGYGAPIPFRRALKPGDTGVAVAELRRKLAAIGDLAPELVAPPRKPALFVEAQPAPMLVPASFGVEAPAAPQPPISAPVEEGETVRVIPAPPISPPPQYHYDADLADAVARFQARHGLEVDGVAGKATFDALNVSIEARMAQLLLTMERLRWRDSVFVGRYVVVNQAAFELAVMDNGVPVLESRVVIGKPSPRFRTPEFSDEITHVVVNPSWHVPYSIASREILPELRANPHYLNNNDMVLTNSSGSQVNPLAVDWHSVSTRGFPFRIRQRPGDRNALGQVKVIFPNQFNVYLHDTQSRNLFDRARRAYSHGCVRVHKPLELARAVLALRGGDPAAVDRALATGREQTINLSEPLPVHLTYVTGWVDAAGMLHFREDLYGRDARLAEAMTQAQS